MENLKDASPESSIRVEKAEEVKDLLVKYPENHITKVILFGSTARGEATSPSDIDMCVVFGDDLTDRMVIILGGSLDQYLREKGFLTGQHIPMGLDFSYLRELYFNEDVDIPQWIKIRIENIKKEGLVLYPLSKEEKV